MTDRTIQGQGRALCAKGLKKNYGSQQVLRDLDLTIEPGHIYGLIGRNGAGKTTLLSILTGQNTKNGGEVTYGGEPVWENPRALGDLCFARELNPSSDTKTHLELYKAFPTLGGIVHTHSPYAVAWAQAGRDIPCYGTTHADYFYGAVPCARHLTKEELDEDYEKNTGKIIIDTFTDRGIDPVAVPGVICHSHGPFTWGKDAAQAVYHAVVLEEVAKMALLTRQVDSGAAPAPQYLQDKHYMRKHGPNAYYGQK